MILIRPPAGHCFLMTENLQKAYDAYQQALVNLRDPKDPMLWYGIGILYDRYGSYDYAEEAFSQVMQIQPDFEKANEIYFRLGIIYKQQQKYPQSLEVDFFFHPCRLELHSNHSLNSASNTSSAHLQVLLHKRTFGSRSVTFTSNKKT